MTKRYYETLPQGLCPEADRSSSKELRFVQFDSGYSVGTAGNKAQAEVKQYNCFTVVSVDIGLMLKNTQKASCKQSQTSLALRSF